MLRPASTEECRASEELSASSRVDRRRSVARSGSHSAQTGSLFVCCGVIGSPTRDRGLGHRDHDLALGAAAFDVSECMRGLVEAVRAVDDGTKDS